MARDDTMVIKTSRNRPPRYRKRYPNIDYQKKYIFVHPPKCAGKSIENCLFNKKPIAGSADHRMIWEHREIIGDEFNQFKSFSFARNPFDRLVSIYKWRRQEYDGIELKVTFKEWIMKQQHPATWKWDRPPLKVDEGKHHTERLQFDYMSDPKTGNLCLDFIGRVENIDIDWKIICNEILKEDIHLPHLNKSVRKPYKEYYDTETKLHVSKLWEKDLDTFKYVF